MGTNIGGRLEGVRTTDEPSSAIWFLPELFMTSPEEEQKKAAEAKAREQAKPDKPSSPAGDAFTFVGQLVGDAKNLAVDAVAGQHSGDKVLAGISPQLAAQYKQGKEVQERIASGALKHGHLNETDQRNLDAFNSVRKTISQVPLYDRDSLMRYVEKGIEQKSRTAPHEAAKLASQEPMKPTRSDAVKPAATDAVKPKQSDTSKPPQAETAKPASNEALKSRQHDVMTPAQRDPAKPPFPELGKPAQKDSAPPAQRETSSPTQHEAAKSLASDAVKPRVSDPQVGDVAKARVSDIAKSAVSDVAKASSHSDNRGIQAGESKSPAFTAFERRTSYDARLQQEPNPGVSESSASDAKAKHWTSWADYGAQRSDNRARTESEPNARVPFEKMRRVLDERTASAKEQSHSVFDKTNNAIQQAPDRQPRIDVGDAAHQTLTSASRTTLSEVKASLSSHQMQQLVRTSEERFPAGLRWQNTFQQSNADARTRTPQAGTHQKSDAQISDRSDRPITGRVNPGSPRKSEVPSPAAKPNLPPGKADGQAGSARVGQYGNTRDGQSSSTRDAQSSSIRDAQSSRTRDAQPTSSREQSFGASEKGVLTFPGRVQNRYITGAEIALAAIIAAAGAKRIRFDELPPPGSDRAGQMPLVQSIKAFLPDNQKVEPRGVSTTGQTAEFISEKNANQVPQQQQQNSLTEVGSKRSDSTSNSTEKSVDEDDVPGTARYLQKHHYKRRKMLIGPHDTFVSIAESLVELRNDSRYAWLIADINLPRIKETYVDGKRVVELRSRQEIEIPGEFDVEAFDLHRKDEYSSENLITVVLESQIDRELLDEHLAVFVDGGGPVISAPLPPPLDAFPASSMSPSLLSRNTVAGDASVLLPSLALNSVNVLRVARQQLVEITQQAFESGRKPISKLKNSLIRDRIKRSL